MEEERLIDNFEISYNNEKGSLYLTNRFVIFISEKKKKKKDGCSDLLHHEHIDLLLCITCWKKTEKSKKKNKIRYTFAKSLVENNICYHDYSSTDAFVFEYFDEKSFNNSSEIISSYNKDVISNHTFFNFNIYLLKDHYNIVEGIFETDVSREKEIIIEPWNSTLQGNPESKSELFDNLERKEDLQDLREIDRSIERQLQYQLAATETQSPIVSRRLYEESESEPEEDVNNRPIDNTVTLKSILEKDPNFKQFYDICVKGNILDDKEFCNLHKNYIYQFKGDNINENEAILKEPIYISEEQKHSKNIEVNSKMRNLILTENKELKKLHDYYIMNNIVSENKFWFFLFNNKYSHLFFYDKHDNKSSGLLNEGLENIDEHSVESLSYTLENSNQDVKGTLEKCILKEYLSTKSYNRGNALFKNNYFFSDETPKGFGLITNDKLLTESNNAYYMLINKFNNYCIGEIKDRTLTFQTFYDEIKEKVKDNDLSPPEQKPELLVTLDKKRKEESVKCWQTSKKINTEVLVKEEKCPVNEHFSEFINDLQKNKIQKQKKNSDLFSIGRQLFVFNTKKCQSNQSLLIGSIEYDSHILDIVKEYHVKINYLLRLFYASYIPEQTKRNKILDNLSKIKDEIQSKQEEYNSVLIMGKPLLIHLFEQISICKKFNEKLEKYIQEKRKK